MRTATGGYGVLLDAVSIIHVFCWACITAIVTARIIPASQKRFLTYGARGQPGKWNNNRGNYQSNVQAWLDWLASIDVPHSWFTHFYVLSLASSLFWSFQIATKSRLLRTVSSYVPLQSASAPQPGIYLGMFLMVLQSTRRLWESYQFSRGSRSRMWIGHYIFGLSFYFVMNIAIWVDSIHTLLQHKELDQGVWRVFLGKRRVLLGFCMFLVASLMQHLAHAHLASLPKYSLPRHWLFRKLIAPHYTAECGIYLGLAMITASDQHIYNPILFSMVLLTTVNLSITAHDTKGWMMAKFRGAEKEIRKKYCMFLGIW